MIEEHLLDRVEPAKGVVGGLPHVDADLGHGQVPPFQLFCLREHFFCESGVATWFHLPTGSDPTLIVQSSTGSKLLFVK